MNIFRKISLWLNQLDEICWPKILGKCQHSKERVSTWKTEFWNGGSRGVNLYRTGNPIKDWLIWLKFKICRQLDKVDTWLVFDNKKFQAKKCRVRSKSEKKIANWFTDNGINFKYEKPLFIGFKSFGDKLCCQLILTFFGKNLAKKFAKHLRGHLFFPDFYLTKYGWYVEYWGLADTDPDYNELTKAKLALFSRYQISVVSLYPRHLRHKDGIADELAKSIKNFKLSA